MRICRLSYVIKKRVGVSGDNLVDASASVDQFNRPIVSIRFDSIGSRKFADLTNKNVGKRFAIVLDNKVISAQLFKSQFLQVMHRFRVTLPLRQLMI